MGQPWAWPGRALLGWPLVILVTNGCQESLRLCARCGGDNTLEGAGERCAQQNIDVHQERAGD